MTDPLDRLRLQASQHKQTSHLLADGSEELHLAPGVGVRLAVLHIDNADDAIADHYGDGKKRLVGVFRKVAKELEAWILKRPSRNGEQTPLPRHPAGQSFSQLEPNEPAVTATGLIGRAQDQLVTVEQVKQARVAAHVLGDQGNNILKNVLETHLSRHHTADALKEAKLLLCLLEFLLQLFCPRH